MPNELKDKVQIMTKKTEPQKMSTLKAKKRFLGPF